MQYSCGQLVSFVILLAATACIITSIATPYWDYREVGSDTGLGGWKAYRGLFRACSKGQVFGGSFRTKESCKYRFDVEIEGKINVSHDDVQTWEIAVLGLMALSALLSVVALIFSPCCCTRCGCALTFFVLLATLCTAAGVGLYGYKSTSGDSNIFSDIKGVEELNFGWSFWLAVGGGGLQLLATLGFGVSRARQHSYSHTI